MTDLKTTLRQFKKNLSILQERKAKYAGNAPLDLLNQIDDHNKAIDLTRQAITGELEESEWKEALKPLLLAYQNGQVLNIEAETYVARDQNITNIYQTAPPPLSPAESQERQGLTILLNKVKTFWIEGVLEKSIHNIALIDLGKETQTEAVSHAWEQVLELPDQSRQTLPPDKKMGHIFQEMNQALLILGAPGSGKTITLLQLARDLITQVEQDESFTQPVPVVFNLSTWHSGQSLIAWLVNELSTKYQIPKRIGQPWLENHRLLPLLDGLDEVKAEERTACVEAINHFGEEFGLSGLVVCSRIEEYTTLPVRLKLNGAIRLQPLSLEQVYQYLESAGSKLKTLRTALQADDSLKTLAQTPLTLGIMTLAYQGMPTADLTAPANSLEARRKHLFDTYIKRMFQRKGQSGQYSDKQTKNWLTWLAQGMKKHNQSIFLIEQLQPSWLSSWAWVWVYVLSSRLIGGLLIGSIFGLLNGLFLAPFFRLNNTLIPGLGGWLLYGLFVALTGGVLWGIIDGIRLKHRARNNAWKTATSFRQQVINALIVGGLAGLIEGLFAGLFAGLLFGLVSVVIFGTGGGLFVGLRGNRQSITNDIQTVEALNWSWQKAVKLIPLALISGFMIGVLESPIFELNPIVTDTMKGGFLPGLFGRYDLALRIGVFTGLFLGLISAMFGGLTSKISKTKTRPNQGIWLSVRNCLLLVSSFGLISWVFCALLAWVLFGSENVLNPPLFLGSLVGLSVFIWYGGIDVIQHYTLRLTLWYKGYTPRNYTHFLDYATERIFMQKIGGGYIFIHRLLLEHFAGMDGEGE